MGRRYPVLPSDGRARRPISFVVVRFSDEYEHNLMRSSCVVHPLNELITVDNRGNLFFDNLSQAIDAGLDRARHELVVVVHEDVLLVDGWQPTCERSLVELERRDPNWGLVGVAGWIGRRRGRLVGHWSDPYGYRNTLRRRPFQRVHRIDEQLMALRASSGIRLDPLLPSIHNIGRDLASTFRARGLHTYVIDAPTIHKFADGAGRRIERPAASPKIAARRLPADQADRACCDEYLFRKWPQWRPAGWVEQRPVPADAAVGERLSQPVVLLTRGGSGSRLLSALASDCGVNLGNKVNASGDSVEMVEPVYMGVLNTLHVRAPWQRAGVVPALRHTARRVFNRPRKSDDGLWGFKLPESMLIVPEIAQAFPAARYIHLLRDPLATCLRRTHMTARFDNPIGRVAIREAYHHCKRDLALSLEDSPGLHMAYTTIHQIESVRDFARRELGDRYVEIRFEDLITDPHATAERVADWLGATITGHTVEDAVDPERAALSGVDSPYSPEVDAAVAGALRDLRGALGYV